MKGATDATVNRRKVLQLTGAATLTAGLGSIAGCLDDPSESEANEIVITQGAFPETVDPNNHITGPTFNVYDQIYEPLFNVTPGEEIGERVVTDWEHSEDGGEVDLTIRDDVVFHNGDDLVADDIAFTMNRVVDPEMGPTTDQVAGLTAITGAEAVDDTTVRLEYDGAPSLAEFQFGNYARAVNEAWAGEQETSEGAIVGGSADVFNGTGPYEVVEFEDGVEIVLEPFDDYWGETPAFERVTFNADGESTGRVSSLQTDESQLVDNVLPNDVSDVRDQDGIGVRRITSFRNIFCVMRNTVEPFDSQEFRQAMNYAIDNEGIINDSLSGFGEPMSQPTPEGVNGYNPDLDPYPQDIEEAETLVDASGYAGAELTLTVPEGRYLNDADIGQLVADQIDQLENVSCEADIVDFQTVSDASAAGIDSEERPFFLIGWGVVTGDADYGLSGWVTEGGGVHNFQDEAVEESLVESQNEEDPDAREELLQEINADLREKAPWIFLHLQESIYGVRSDIEWEPREDESIYTWEMS